MSQTRINQSKKPVLYHRQFEKHCSKSGVGKLTACESIQLGGRQTIQHNSHCAPGIDHPQICPTSTSLPLFQLMVMPSFQSIGKNTWGHHFLSFFLSFSYNRSRSLVGSTFKRYPDSNHSSLSAFHSHPAASHHHFLLP